MDPKLLESLKTLNSDEKLEALRTLNFPPPSNRVADLIWLLVIAIVGVVAIGGGTLAYLLIDDGLGADAIVGLASAALGGLVGLLVPSPVGN